MKFGIVGTNFVSDFFMDATKYVDNCEVVSVCSGKRENADKFAIKHNIENVYDNYLEMIDSKTIDAIYLAVPNALHHDISIECMKRNIPTFTEKPFGVNSREVKEMFKASKENKTYIHDGIIPLYTENFKILKEKLHKVGKIKRAVFCFNKYSSRYDAYLRGENPTTFRRELCNGSTLDLGVYCIALAIGLFGSPKKITASGSLLETGVDAFGTAIFDYGDFDSVIMYSKVSDTKMLSEIQGEKGVIQIDIVSLLSNIIFYESCRMSEGIKISQYHENPFSFQIDNFINNVSNGLLESDLVSHDLSLKIIEAVDECRRQIGVVYEKE